jgi:hypothetical protein
MKSHPAARATRCFVPGMALTVLLAWNSAAAETGGVTVRPEFYLTGIANYFESNGDSYGFETLATTTELNVYPEHKRYWGGLFIDYRSSTSARLRDNLNVGGYFRYNLARWDATAWLFSNHSPNSPGTAIYAARLRYRVSDGSRLGIEALAPVEAASRPMLMLGYYADIADSVSIKLFAGSGVRNGRDFAARMELIWKAF